MRFVCLIPLLCGLAPLITASPIAGTPAQYEDARGNAAEALWSDKTEGRVSQFRDLWKQHDDRSRARTKLNTETDLDGKFANAEARENGKNQPQAASKLTPESSAAPMPKKKSPFQHISKRQSAPYPNSTAPEPACRGAVPAGLQGDAKYPNPEGFFRFSESVIGTKYSPEDLQNARNRLASSLSEVSARERTKHSEDPPPAHVDIEFLRFAGLSIEEVAPTSKDVFHDEAKKAGLDDLHRNKRLATSSNSRPEYEDPYCQDWVEGREPNFCAGDSDTWVVLIEDVRRYIIYHQIQSTEDYAMEGNVDVTVNIGDLEPLEIDFSDLTPFPISGGYSETTHHITGYDIAIDMVEYLNQLGAHNEDSREGGCEDPHHGHEGHHCDFSREDHHHPRHSREGYQCEDPYPKHEGHHHNHTHHGCKDHHCEDPHPGHEGHHHNHTHHGYKNHHCEPPREDHHGEHPHHGREGHRSDNSPDRWEHSIFPDVSRAPEEFVNLYSAQLNRMKFDNFASKATEVPWCPIGDQATLKVIEMLI